jgi:hypothetical protein
MKFLKTLFPQVYSILESVPYLIIHCRGSVPEPSKRPFMIGSLLGVWIIDTNYPLDFHPGHLGNLKIRLELDDETDEDIPHWYIPKIKTLYRLLHEGFPDALALSYFDNLFLVELPELPPSEHGVRL